MLFILRGSIYFYNIIITNHIPLLTNLLINKKFVEILLYIRGYVYSLSSSVIPFLFIFLKLYYYVLYFITV